MRMKGTEDGLHDLWIVREGAELIWNKGYAMASVNCAGFILPADRRNLPIQCLSAFSCAGK
jgi:hypothetical protein